MKRTTTILTITLLVTASCGGSEQSTGDFITVDVTNSYPKKELILQDFMDVEYVALETTDEFLNEGIVLAVGKEIMLVGNRNFGNRTNDRDIFVYDRTGKGLRKINRLGRGPGEYTTFNEITLDEENGEIFIIDPFKGILVYDLYGNFKRSFNPKGQTRLVHTYNYDKDHLICLGASPFSTTPVNFSSFLIISKHDGSVINDIQIPVIERTAPLSVQIRTENYGGWAMMDMTFFFHSLIPYHNDWILTEPSSDTVFRYQKDHSMRPFIVRTPPRQKMSHETLLFPGILTDHYYFMIVLKEDIGAESPWPSIPNNPIMATTNLVYDMPERNLFTSTVYNGDYSDNREVSMFQQSADNSEIAFWLKIDADKLVSDFKKGILKGKLKEIATELDEEDNPIIMLVKYKN